MPTLELLWYETMASQAPPASFSFDEKSEQAAPALRERTKSSPESEAPIRAEERGAWDLPSRRNRSYLGQPRSFFFSVTKKFF